MSSILFNSAEKGPVQELSISPVATKLSQSTAVKTDLHKILETNPQKSNVEFEAKGVEELWNNMNSSFLKSSLHTSLVSNKIFSGSNLTGKELKALIANPAIAKQLHMDLEKGLMQESMNNSIGNQKSNSDLEINNTNIKKEVKSNGTDSEKAIECKKNIDTIKKQINALKKQCETLQKQIDIENSKDNKTMVAELEAKKSKFDALLQNKEGSLKEEEKKLKEEMEVSISEINQEDGVLLNIPEDNNGKMTNEKLNKNEDQTIEENFKIINEAKAEIEKIRMNKNEVRKNIEPLDLKMSEKDFLQTKNLMDKRAKFVSDNILDLEETLQATLKDLSSGAKEGRMQAEKAAAEAESSLVKVQEKITHLETHSLLQAIQNHEKAKERYNDADSNHKSAVANQEPPMQIEVRHKELLEAGAEKNSSGEKLRNVSELLDGLKAEARNFAETVRRKRALAQTFANQEAEAARLQVQVEHEIIENRLLLLDLQQYSAQITLALAEKEQAATLAEAPLLNKNKFVSDTAEGKSEKMKDNSSSHETRVQANRKEIALIEASLNAIAFERRKLQHKLEELEKALDVDIDKGEEVSRILENNIKNARILGQSNIRA